MSKAPPDIPGGYPQSEIDKMRREEGLPSIAAVADGDLEAGDSFRNSLVPHADAMQGSAPLWFGWAIMDAFLAGAEHARRSANAKSK